MADTELTRALLNAVAAASNNNTPMQSDSIALANAIRSQSPLTANTLTRTGTVTASDLPAIGANFGTTTSSAAAASPNVGFTALEDIQAAAKAAIAAAQNGNGKPKTKVVAPANTAGTGGTGDTGFTGISGVTSNSGTVPTGTTSGVGNPIFNPLTTDFTRPVLQDGATLAKKYGIEYGYDNIKNIYKDAVDASYDSQRKVYDQATAAYYETIRNNAASLLDALRKANAGAIATGTSRGVAAAQQLSALLAAAQSGSQGALDIANKIFNLGDTYKADTAQAYKDALTASNAAGATLGQISNDQYAAMVQAWAAELAAQGNTGSGYSSGGYK